MRPTRPVSESTLLAIFFLSGGTGLVYEVLWVRLLGLLFGNTVHAVSTVLAIFLGGLALGAFLAGRWIDRRPGASPLAVYGTLEIAIGLYCLAVPALLGAAEPAYGAVYRATGGNLALLTAARAAVSVLSLLLPTALMGATLPVLSRFVVALRGGSGGPVGTLYGVNTLGAGFGTLLAGFYLIPVLGVSVTNGLAAATNLALGAGVLLWARSLGTPAAAAGVREETATAAESQDAPPGVPLPRGGIAWLYGAYALTGFASLLAEVTWTRALTLVLGSTTYAFTLMLGTFITFMGAGAFVSARRADRVRAPLDLLSLLAFGGAVATLAVLPLIGNLPLWTPRVVPYLKGHFELIVGFQLVLIVLVMALPTFLLGTLFPLIVRVTLQGARSVGRTVGRLYAVNTLGTILGSLTTGFLLIPAIGIQRTMMAGALLAALAGLLFAGLRPVRPVRTRLAAGTAGWLLTAAVAFSLPAWDRDLLTIGPYAWALSSRLQSGSGDGESVRRAARSYDLLFYREGPDVTVTVRQDRTVLENRFLQINGKLDASSAEDMRMQVLLGQLPLLLHPDPREALLVGLATGTSLGAVETHPEIARIDCAEISSAVRQATRFFDAYNHRALDDPRARVTIQDGRNFLAFTPRRYDVIISQPTTFWVPGVAYLATREYFQEARDHLLPGGLMAMWIASYELSLEDFRSVVATFLSVFPEATLWRGGWGVDFLLIGAKDGTAAIPWDRFQAAWKTPAVRDDLARVALRTPTALLGQFLMGPRNLQDFSRGATIHRDDRPFVEFRAARAWYSSAAPIQDTITRHVESPLPYLRGASPGEPAWDALIEKLPALLAANRDLFAASKLREKGKGDQVIERLERVQGRLGEDSPVAEELGSTYVKLGSRALSMERTKIAEESLRKAMDTDPSNVEAPFALAYLRMKAGDRYRAAEILEAAHRSGASSRRTHLVLGQLYLRQGRTPQAGIEFRQALEKDPRNAETHRVMGFYEIERGAWLSAMDHLQESLQLDPGQAEAPRMASALAELEGRVRDREAVKLP